ncbi:MAG: ChaN family lipoprotein, partial [Bdellovibrionales bacterium]|nr:ChaN family lipoprotein [Bdellovibrionales bacterium]
MGFDSRQWLLTRQRLLQQLKAQVAIRLGPQPKDVFGYAGEYKREFDGRWLLCEDEGELGERLYEVQLVLGGDFHAFSQAQRSHLRLLRDLPKNRPVVLGMECIESCDQEAVDAFLEGEISEEDFLETVNWDEHWGFPWENYRPLFDLARERGFKVLALNRYFARRTGSTLGQRDRHAAQVISKAFKEHPDHLFYILFGDLHLADQHLPLALIKAFKGKLPSMLRLFLNSERLYFRLARRGDVGPQRLLKASRNRYCLLTSPPWVKWQSYLIYLEQTYDRELGEDEAIDYTDHLAALIKLAAEDLAIKIKAQDFAVYGPEDGDFPARVAGHFDRNQERLLIHLVDHDRSFFLPEGGLCYLSRPTINHAAGLAGQYLQARLSRRHRPPWDMPHDFLPAIWVEAMSFLVSKLINPNRKSESLRQLRRELEAGDPKGRGKETLLVVLDQRMSEMIQIHSKKLRPRRFRPRRKVSYFEAARILGNMMGERLFQAFKKGRMSRNVLVDFFSQDVFDPHFEDFYFQAVRRLESHDPESPRAR